MRLNIIKWMEQRPRGKSKLSHIHVENLFSPFDYRMKFQTRKKTKKGAKWRIFGIIKACVYCLMIRY